jgi:hypothetical protein
MGLTGNPDDELARMTSPPDPPLARATADGERRRRARRRCTAEIAHPCHHGCELNTDLTW